MKTAENTTVEEMQKTADLYARHFLDYIGADNGERFTNDRNTKHHEDNGNDLYVRHRHFPHQSIALWFNQTERTATVLVLNGYRNASTSFSLDDYTPDNEDTPAYVLGA